MRALCCTLLLTIMTKVCLAQSPKCNRYAVGCTANNTIENYKGRFTSSCELHDLCYSCGSMLYISREGCDKMFRYYMQTACDSSALCRIIKDLNYAKARSSGRDNFYQTPKTYCSQPWVRPCLLERRTADE